MKMDNVEKGFAQASDTSKLLLTLSTALIAFCAAIVNVKAADITLFAPITLGGKVLLSISWLLLLSAVGMGIWTQLAITDVLSSATDEQPANPWSRKITFPFQAQIITFGLGVVLLVSYGIIRLFG